MPFAQSSELPPPSADDRVDAERLGEGAARLDHRAVGIRAEIVEEERRRSRRASSSGVRVPACPACDHPVVRNEQRAGARRARAPSVPDARLRRYRTTTRVQRPEFERNHLQ